MKMQWSIAGLVALGLFAALCAALLVGVLRLGSSGAAVPSASNEVAIVVAAKALPAMTTVQADHVTAQKVQRKDVPPDVLTEPIQVIGKALVLPMAQGQVFTQACFVPPGTGVQAAASLPDGMRAVSVSLPDHSGLEGILYPGSVVDVMASFNTVPGRLDTSGDAVATTLLQKIQVLAIENRTVFMTEGKAVTGEPAPIRKGERRLVTLMVDPAQARALELATEHGSISLAMRNPLDQQVAESKPVLISDLFKDLQPAPTALATKAEFPAPPWTGPSPSPVAVQTKVEPASAKKEEPPAPKWDVLIIRGGSRETASFDLQTDKPVASPQRSGP